MRVCVVRFFVRLRVASFPDTSVRTTSRPKIAGIIRLDTQREAHTERSARNNTNNAAPPSLRHQVRSREARKFCSNTFTRVAFLSLCTLITKQTTFMLCYVVSAVASLSRCDLIEERSPP